MRLLRYTSVYLRCHLLVNAQLRSRVWENHKHGSDGVSIVMKRPNILGGVRIMVSTKQIAREHMEFSPSDKEWIVMLLYAHGLQKEVVARMLNKSLPTIVTQIESIKNKTGLMNRFEMMMYLKDKEEDKNINFFVPYIPENAA